MLVHITKDRQSRIYNAGTAFKTDNLQTLAAQPGDRGGGYNGNTENDNNRIIRRRQWVTSAYQFAVCPRHTHAYGMSP